MTPKENQKVLHLQLNFKTQIWMLVKQEMISGTFKRTTSRTLHTERRIISYSTEIH